MSTVGSRRQQNRCSAHGRGLSTLREAVALPVHLKDVNAVSEAVQQGAGQSLRAEDLSPLVEGQVGGDEDRPPSRTSD